MSTIEDYVGALERRLAGPARLKADMLREVRDSLADAAEAYADRGLGSGAAQERAVAEFGAVGELAPAYQAELALGAARQLVLRIAAAAAIFSTTSWLTWYGAPWTDGPQPPLPGYFIVSETVDLLGFGKAIAGVLALLALQWMARRAPAGRLLSRRVARGVGVGAVVVLAPSYAAGFAIWVMTAWQWPASLTWPPMIVGGAIMGAAYVWLARSARDCLVAARTMT